MSLRRSLVLGILLLAVAIGGAFAYRGVVADTAADLDRLRAASTTALPIIQALERHRKERGGLPREAADIAGMVPDGIIAEDIGHLLHFDTGQAPGWVFEAGPDRTTYELSHRLEPDTRIFYRDAGGQGQWLWDRGDGVEPVPADAAP
jgi:hypothetical protein